MSSNSAMFHLPPKGTFQSGGPNDPLPYYYQFVVGRFYSGRINRGLSLLAPPYESLLEVGYGSGLLLPTLSCICTELVAIDRGTDPASVMPTLSRLGVNATLIKGDIASVDISGKRFDLIVAFSVLEHVPDPLPVLKGIHRLLKPGGELLVGIPRVDRVMELLFRLIGYKGIKNEHLNTYADFLKMAQTVFDLRLERFATLPRFAPRFAALYYNMLLKKPKKNESGEPGKETLFPSYRPSSGHP